MTLARCIFCGKEQEDFKGTYLVKNEGVMIYYCSSKCRKNHLKLGRDKKKLKWTVAFREAREYAAAKHAASEAKKHAEHESVVAEEAPHKKAAVKKK